MIKIRWKNNNTFLDTSVQFLDTSDQNTTGVKNTDLNMIIDVINNGIEVINKLKEDVEKEQQASVLIFNLQNFTEYVEDIDLGMQLTRLRLLNPKLKVHEP